MRACSSARGYPGGGVSGYTRQEVAQRAGVDPDYVDRLVKLGILRPDAGDAFSPGDVLRTRWLQSFERAGVPLEGIAAAVRDGALSFSYLDATAFDRFAGLSGTTFHQLSAQTGIPLELLMVVREAFGFAEPRSRGPRPPGRAVDRAGDRAPALEGFRPIVIERWLRVCGDSLRRITETETAWWHSEVMTPLLASGMTEGEMLAAQADLGSQMAPLSGASPPRYLLRAAGTHLEPGDRRARRGRAGTGGSVPPVGAAAGNVLPRHHRVHAPDRGAGR